MIDSTLERLALTFTVRDIMVPRSSLVCGKSSEECFRLLHEHHDYNLIPLVTDSRVTGYVDRQLGQRSIDLHEDVISDSMSLMDLMDVLRRRTFSFVLVGGRIGGYVHFSDLNNRLVELSFYVLLQAVEHHLIGRIKPLAEGELVDVLGGGRAGQLKKLMSRQALKDANLDIFSVVQLKDILAIAKARTIIDVSDERIDEVYRVRNSVSHAESPLVGSHAEVESVAWVKDYCLGLLEAGASL
jgi:hypothetical protein